VRTLDEADPLFDGAAIGGDTCLAASESAAAFQTTVPASAQGAATLEMRLMGSKSSANEDMLVIAAELWVR
jgi:hypothetical protein